jgi:outer membrane protein
MKKAIPMLCLLFFTSSKFIAAQQKYGHINSVDVLEAMPEYKQMNNTIENRKKQYSSQLQKMYQDYQQKGKELQEYGANMMEAVREEQMKEVDSLQREISSFQENVQGEIQKLQLKLMKPLNDKYLKVMQTVAKENGYTYVFDLSSGFVAYHPENTGDITEQVKKKMGIN